MAALQWNDIDLDNRIATICRGLVRGKIEDTTKSGLDRDIDLTPQLTREMSSTKISSGGQGLVFKNPEGNAVNFNLFSACVQQDGSQGKTEIPPDCMTSGIPMPQYYEKMPGYSLCPEAARPQQTQHYPGCLFTHFLEDDSPIRMVDALGYRISHQTAPHTHPKQKRS